MNFTPLDRMQPADIVAEIGSLCRELQTKLARIHNLSNGLYQRVRRAPADDNTAIYMRYANAWSRFAGMAQQGVRRVSASDKLLSRLAPGVKAPESIGKPVKQAPVASTPVESLLDMYGEEFAVGRSAVEAE